MNCVGWLDNRGNLIECNGRAHLDIAREICKKMKYNKEEQPDDVLLKHGWVRISRMVYGEHGLNFWLPHFITANQRNFLQHIVDEGIEVISDLGQKTLKENGIDFYV